MKSLSNPQDAAEIRTRILSLTAGDKPLWGVMSVVEMICHLREAYLYAMSDESAVHHRAGPLPPKVMKRFALHAPMRWPQNVATVPGLEVGGARMNPVGFAEDRATLLAAFDRFCSASSLTKDHPFFTTMAHADWLRWGYLHPDHHLRQFGR